MDTHISAYSTVELTVVMQKLFQSLYDQFDYPEVVIWQVQVVKESRLCLDRRFCSVKMS